MRRLTTEGRLAATTLRDRAGAAAVPGPYLVLDLGRGVTPTRLGVAGAAGEAAGGPPPPTPRPSMPATRRPPTAAARPGVAACGS
jgi:hypothetical protein